MIKILIGPFNRVCLAGCQTTNNYEIYKGKAPYIEGTSTKDRLIVYDLDNQLKLQLCLQIFRTDRSKKTWYKVFSIVNCCHTRCIACLLWMH